MCCVVTFTLNMSAVKFFTEKFLRKFHDNKLIRFIADDKSALVFENIWLWLELCDFVFCVLLYCATLIHTYICMYVYVANCK